MKIQNLYITVSAILLFSFYGCGNGNDPVENTSGLKFRAVINDYQEVRANENSWTVGDEIGIYMVNTGDALLQSSALYDNIRYVTATGNGEFLAAGQQFIRMPESGNVDFIAYHNYAATVDNFSIPMDISGQSGDAMPDLLYARERNVGNTAVSVNFAFNHALTKISFNVTDQSGAGLTGLKSTIKGLATRSVFSLATGSFTDEESSISDITAITSAQESTATAQAVIFPTTGTSGAAVNFTNGNVNLDYKFPDGTAFLSGRHYIYTATIGPEGELTVTGSIKGWNDRPGDDINLEV